MQAAAWSQWKQPERLSSEQHATHVDKQKKARAKRVKGQNKWRTKFLAIAVVVGKLLRKRKSMSAGQLLRATSAKLVKDYAAAERAATAAAEAIQPPQPTSQDYNRPEKSVSGTIW